MRARFLVVLLLTVAAGAAFAQQTVVSNVGRGDWEAWPDVCRLSNGELLCVFIGGASPGGAANAIFSMRSGDDGVTWSAPEVMVDTPHTEQEANITQLSDGRLVVAYWNFDCSDVFLIWSSDGGYTWTPPERQKLPHLPAPWDAALYASDPIRELDDGSLVLAVYGAHNTRPYYFTTGVARSTNRGRTWTMTALPNPDELWWPEPGLAQALDGSLWLLIRPNLLFSRSTNRGRSWSTPVSITKPGEDVIEGHAPYLMWTSAGAGLLAARRPQFRIFHDERTTWCPQVINTMDNGASWTRFAAIDTDTEMGAYCSLVELPGDRVLCLYYVDRFSGETGTADIRQAIVHAGYGGMHVVPAAQYPHEFAPGWQMTGTPSGTALPQVQTGLQASRVLRWAPGSGAYASYKNDFVRGRGLWVYRSTPQYVTTTPALSAAAVRVGLSAGWNLISPPTTGAVPWDAAHLLTDGGAQIRDYAFTWSNRNARYELVTPTTEGSAVDHQLLPWRGYWIYSSAPGGLRLVPGRTQPLTPPRRSVAALPAGATEGAAWSLRLVLTVNGKACGDTQIGAGSTAREVLAPPAPPEAAGSIGAADGSGPLCLYQLKSAGETSWQVRVRASEAGTCRLAWAFTKTPASTSPLTISLEGTARSMNVRDRKVWSWTAATAGEKVFRVQLGTPAPLSLQAAAANTRGGLAVTCTASAPGRVTLTLRNVAGRTVARPQQRPLAAGTQQLLIPACTPSGLTLPAGRYVCEVAAVGADGGRATAVCSVVR